MSKHFLYQCCYCDYSAPEFSMFQRHVSEKHRLLLPHSPSNVEKDMKEQPFYECHYCDYSVSEFSMFVKHMKQRHHLIPSHISQNEKEGKESILLEAHDVVRKRRDNYGGPKENFTNIAKMWSVIFDRKVTLAEVGLCMIALKMCRQMHKPGRDNLVDIAGYADCMDVIREAVEHSSVRSK